MLLPDVLSNGIELEATQTADNLVLETLQNINPINHIVQAVCAIPRKSTLSVSLGNARRCRVESPLQEHDPFRREYRLLPSQVETEIAGDSTERLLRVSAKTDNLVDSACDASHSTNGKNSVLQYVHNLPMSTSRWMCHATVAVDVKERICYAVWFANLALHRSQEIATMLVNSSNVGYHTTRRTLTRMLDAGAAGPPVCHCPADSPGQGLPGQYTKNSE